VVPKKGRYAGQSRIDHVRLHNVDNPSKPQHGVFYGDGYELANEAWEKAQKIGISPNNDGVLKVPMDKIVGRAGGKAAETGELFYSLEIIVVPNTNKLIAAYPVNYEVKCLVIGLKYARSVIKGGYLFSKILRMVIYIFIVKSVKEAG